MYNSDFFCYFNYIDRVLFRLFGFVNPQLHFVCIYVHFNKLVSPKRPDLFNTNFNTTFLIQPQLTCILNDIIDLNLQYAKCFPLCGCNFNSHSHADTKRSNRLQFLWLTSGEHNFQSLETHFDL